MIQVIYEKIDIQEFTSFLFGLERKGGESRSPLLRKEYLDEHKNTSERFVDQAIKRENSYHKPTTWRGGRMRAASDTTR